MIRTYLDTGVLIAAFGGSDEVSERAMHYVEDENRVFITSDILELELLELFPNKNHISKNNRL